MNQLLINFPSMEAAVSALCEQVFGAHMAITPDDPEVPLREPPIQQRNESPIQQRNESLIQQRDEAVAAGFELLNKLDETRELLERERICHAACGVIARGDTREVLTRNTEGIHADYMSGSVRDCIHAMDRELATRERLKKVISEMRAQTNAREKLEAQIREELDLAERLHQLGLNPSKLLGNTIRNIRNLLASR